MTVVMYFLAVENLKLYIADTCKNQLFTMGQTRKCCEENRWPCSALKTNSLLAGGGL